MSTYDVTVIGAGPGGYVAAIRAAQRGASVALIERAWVGGTCLNWGCIPTKCLISSAEMLENLAHAADFGITFKGKPKPDWSAMLSRKDAIVDNLRNGIQSLIKSNKIKLIQGTASFAGRHDITVQTAKGEEKLSTTSTIIATGSDSVMPAFIPEAPNILYSRQALEHPVLPARMLILGGGVIGCEFACMYARLGVSVTLVELLPQILPMVDADVARVVVNRMKKLGIEVLTGSRMEGIASTGTVVSASVGKEKLQADQMVVCVGRRPYADGLNLAAAGLHVNDAGMLTVDAKCRTRVPSIYAVGDLTGPIQYAHRASAMGIVAANNATGQEDAHSDARVPGCIFTTPEIGCVGLTETQAKEQKLAIQIGKFPFAALGKAQIQGETDGFCKIVADDETDQVLGVEIVGPHATDLIAEAATAMNLEITAEELGRAMHAHPTLGEASMEAAHAVHDRCIHMPPRRRR